MIIITKQEKDKLLALNCVFGEDLHHTLGKGNKKTYYATESKKVLSLLSTLRKN